MIIRSDGSGWILSQQGCAPLRFATHHEVVAELNGSPADSPIGLIFPCGGDLLAEAWTPLTAHAINRLAENAECLPVFVQTTLDLADVLIKNQPGKSLWLGNDSWLYNQIPEPARRYAITQDLGTEQFKRFGTDGLAHDWALRRSPAAGAGRTITIHLCEQTSLTAYHDGRSVETSTGFSGLEGMGGQTTCGQLDPGVVLKLAEQIKDPAALDHLLRAESGWNGFLGKSLSLVDLLSLQDIQIARCQAIFRHQLVREIGALAAVLGGSDQIIYFGQNHPAITDWVKYFHQNLPILAEVESNWLDYADWMLEEQIYSAGPQNSLNPSA